MPRFPRLHEALDYAAEAHRDQVRKGTNIPYLAHVIGVCSLTLDYGGDEDQAIAALLHDVIEDCGAAHEGMIRARFGERVARIVLDLTDAIPDAAGAKPPWRERKEAYVRHLPQVDDDAILVSACDKLHNARAIGADLRAEGPGVFERFTGGRDGTLWYYPAITEVFAERLGRTHPLVIELNVAVKAMGV
jgi:GTP pyrophosphokinase